MTGRCSFTKGMMSRNAKAFLTSNLSTSQSGNLVEHLPRTANSIRPHIKAGKKGPNIVQVYEKIKAGIWTDNGFFHLVDSWIENDGIRNVFKFKLVAVESVSDESAPEENANRFVERSRIIPTSVKLEVWSRDGGKCVTCGATDELHFDHILPFSKGGTSLKAENIQLLCARHNLSKSAKIQ